jgi:hypothetical protein
VIFHAFSGETYLSACKRYHLAPLPGGKWVVTMMRTIGRPHLQIEPGLSEAMRWCMQCDRSGLAPEVTVDAA